MNPVPILIVDDQQENLLVLELALKPLGLNCTTCLSATEAMNHATQTEFALMILDVHMPGTSGIELAQQVRQTTQNKSTPVLFLTADTSTLELVDQAYELGAADYLFKPINVRQIRSKAAVFVELFKRNSEALELNRVIRQQSEQMAQIEKDHAIRKLAGGVAHNLNNRLTVIRGNIELIRELTSVDDSAIEDLTHAIDESTDIILSLLKYAGSIQIGKNRTSLADTFTILKRLLPEDHPVNVTLDDKDGELAVDDQALMNILLPIMLNAIDATANVRDPIGVSCTSKDGKLELTVANSGERIPDDLRSSIFDPFSSSAQIHEKTGLGLAMARGTALSLGGDIDFRDGQPTGTIFTITLPIENLVAG